MDTYELIKTVFGYITVAVMWVAFLYYLSKNVNADGIGGLIVFAVITIVLYKSTEMILFGKMYRIDTLKEATEFLRGKVSSQ